VQLIITYLNNHEFNNNIDVKYINIMLKITKDFAGNASLDINNYKVRFGTISYWRNN